MRTVLSAVRKELLDFGLRNPLLNYRPLKSRGVTVTSIAPAEVYRSLVSDTRELPFLANEMLRLTPGGRAENGSEIFSEAALAIPGRRKQQPRLEGLPTIHTAEDLDQRLLATYYAAKSSLDEQGVNTLYIALGCLSWSDPATPDDFHRAPLILIPTELERKNAAEGFTAKYNGDDILPNVCLLEFMKQSHGIEIEPYSDSEELDVEDYFRRVRKAVSRQSGWTVDIDSVALGFFSFAKFLMYRDLDPATWDQEDRLLQHDILNRLLGNKLLTGESSSFGENDFVDDHLQLHPLDTVVDADSTQTLALLDAAAGTNMVIQGPPGTGKSQTIVNLIAHALGADKKVLFVSEKRAALDVVKQRLDKVGLGTACLELHSNKVKKKSVIEELKRTAGIRSASQNGRTAESLLSESKTQLDDYCNAVNSAPGASGETVRDLYGLLLRIMESAEDIVVLDLALPGAEAWSKADVERRRRKVQQLQDCLVPCSSPMRNTFWGTELRVVLPNTVENVRRTALRLKDNSQRLLPVVGALSKLLNQECPDTGSDLTRFIASARQLVNAPDLKGLDAQRTEWKERGERISRALAVGQQLSALRKQWENTIKDSAWSADVQETEAVLLELRGKWWKPFSPRWRHAKAEVSNLINTALPSAAADIVAIPQAIRTASELSKDLSEHETLCRDLFANRWSGLASDWDGLSGIVRWINSCLQGIRDSQLYPWCLAAAISELDRSNLKIALSECDVILSDRNQSFNHLSEVLKLDPSKNGQLTNSMSQLVLADAVDFWVGVADTAPDLENLVRYLQSQDECNKDGLSAIAKLSESWTAAAEHLCDLFEYARAIQLLDLAFSSDPVLAQFDGELQSSWVATFRDADAQSLQSRRVSLAARHASSVPRPTAANGQLGVLLREFEKKARHLAVRQLMTKAGNAIQAIKPVFMMSPLSVANFLPPEAIEFDLVVFDEASQVRPADALGAIVRGKQAIVVGDSKQLPPTSFFDAMVASGDDAADEEDDTATSDIESVLGLFCSRGAHQRMLRWHYRSKHESLIAGSNHLFYEDKLVVFPSPDLDRRNVGLVYRRVAEGKYDRSRTRTNRVEARTIATAVMQHAKEQVRLPREQRLTLGVAALSKAQMDAIRDEIELLRRKAPACEDFFSDSNEQFFVKNLETVQGDERDVIFISIGYGRTAEGYLSMSFGPVNRAGGERRLNVLFSRARRRCEVFTSLSSADIDTTRNDSVGLSALKTFLHYAEHGQLDVPVYTGGAPQSPFEEQVLRALQMLGHTVHTQVGSAGFFLDLAIVHPEKPGTYLLGIECDGAAYHSARSTRDRDRLREAVLVGMGWRIHRIWSTSWFRNAERELEAVKAAIAAALKEKAAPLSLEIPTETSQQESDGRPVSLPGTDDNGATGQTRQVLKYTVAKPYVDLGNAELHLVPVSKLSDWLTQVVEAEAPIHWLEATRRVAGAAQVSRVGGRIQSAFRRACEIGAKKKLFAFKGEFLHTLHGSSVRVRDRSDLPPQLKKLEYISPEEMQAAIQFAVAESFGIGEGEVATAACRLLGFSRVTEEMRAAVEDERDYLLKVGRLVVRGDILVCTGTPQLMN